jgi:preprotein translocase subunit SecD
MKRLLAGIVLSLPLSASAAEPIGLNLILLVDLEKAGWPQTALKDSELAIARRLSEFGVPEALVEPAGKDRLVVVIPRTENPEQILRLVQTTALLELRLVRFPTRGGAAREEILQHFGGQLPVDLEFLEQEVRNDGKVAGKEYYAVERRRLITGTDIKTARPSLGQFNDPIVHFRLNETAAEVFGKETEANVGSALAIVLDGKVVSAPSIRSRIEGEGIIQGAFTESEVHELAMLLRSGPLPAPVKLIETKYTKPAPPNRRKQILILGGAIAFLLFIATLVGLYRRSDPARPRL